MNTSLSLLTKHVRGVLAASAAFSVMAIAPVHAQEAAEAMKLDANNLNRLEVIDEIVPEPKNGAHSDPAVAADLLKAAIVRNLKDIVNVPIDELLERRYAKFRRMGQFNETES